MSLGGGGVQTKTTFKVTPETIRHIPNPMFTVLLIGLNALFVLGSPLLFILGDTNHWNGLFAGAFFILPIGICYTLATHKRVSRWLIVLQAVLVAIWQPQPIYLLAVGLVPLYIFIARIPRLYYRVLSQSNIAAEDISSLNTWPKGTLTAMDWFSEIINWLFILGAIFLFVSLFIPGWLIDYQ